MSKKYSKKTNRSSRKVWEPRGRVDAMDAETVQLSLPIAEVLAGVQDALEQVIGEAGLLIIRSLLEEEAEQRAGKRYSRDSQQRAMRWGQAQGYVAFAGRKVAMDRPRLRDENGEVPLERYRLFQDERMESAVARHVLRGVSTRNYEGVIEKVCEGYGVRRSSVSRQWKAASVRQLKELMERPLGEMDLAVLMLDGIVFQEETVIVALGIASDGQKHVLGLWEGATENATVCRALLEDLVGRGLDPTRRYLCVLDGGKALRRAVEDVLGQDTPIQRCHEHKKRNICDYLPKRYHAMVKRRLAVAWGMRTYDDAARELRKVVKYLGDLSASAAASLEEAFEETLTLHRLEVPVQLRRSLSTTNIIESCLSRTRHLCRNVKRWRRGMSRRWMGAMLIEAQKGFRRLRGYRYMPALINALRPGLAAAAVSA